VSNSAEGAALLSAAAEEEYLKCNSNCYISRATNEQLSLVELQQETSYQRADKLSVSVSSCDMHALVPKLDDDVSDETGSGGKRKGQDLIRSLDSNPPPLNAVFDMFAFTTFDVAAFGLAVKVRRFKTPIFASQAVKLKGMMLLTATQAPYPQCYRVSEVIVDPGMGPQVVSQSFALPRVYLGIVMCISVV
jgi:hypothetical protein